MLRPLIMYFGILKICKMGSYDVIHCHNLFEEGICLLAAKHAGVKNRIAHSHNTEAPKRIFFVEKLYRKLNRILMNYAATLKIGCSNEACRSFFGNSEYKVVLNSVDLSRFSLQKRVHPGKNFIHVGRYTFQKNQEFVIRVFNEIRKNMIDSKLVLVGFGEDEEKLKKVVDAYKLNSCVTFVKGNGANIPDEFAKADYMIFPSTFEGFGIVLIEAQASGVFCFVSENIQKEADAGALHYLKLADGEKAWADDICKIISTENFFNIDDVDKELRKYDRSSIANEYRKIYSNNKTVKG